MTNAQIAAEMSTISNLIRSAASAYQHGRHVTGFEKALAAYHRTGRLLDILNRDQ